MIVSILPIERFIVQDSESDRPSLGHNSILPAGVLMPVRRRTDKTHGLCMLHSGPCG
jgi:hypothetical protein